LPDIATIVRQFLVEEILFDEGGAKVEDDRQLLNGVLDSLGLMQLVAYLEEEFDVDIDDQDMVADNFKDISRITALIQSKQAGAGAGPGAQGEPQAVAP
jgi:acyl carrier protein